MVINKSHPDYDMEVALIHDHNDLLYIIHDKPFSNILSWVEYDTQTGMLNFIMDDGNLQDFGIPISDQYKNNLSVMLEQERGITIKSQTVRLKYVAKDGQEYQLNIMDTPGHVDFAYEVSRSLAACEGSLLIVDATQGVEAQTLANVYQAMDNDHEIIPVINKIDLPAADVDKVKEQIEDVIGIDASDALEVSGKSGIGIDDLLEAIVERLPAPTAPDDAPTKALLVDSWYDTYLGVMILVRV